MIDFATTFIQVTVGDNAYGLNFTLTDPQGNILNLTNAGLTFLAQLQSDPAVQFTGAMTITNASSGQARYMPASTDFPVAGDYNCQIKVLYTGTNEQVTFDNILVRAVGRIPQ